MMLSSRFIPRVAGVGVALMTAMAAPLALADDALEHQRLTALVRQLDLVDQLAGQAADSASADGARYYFDYGRLHDDVQRLREGVQDYLSPARAQPRELAPLSGQYRQERQPARPAPDEGNTP